jgi:hypothetical protein
MGVPLPSAITTTMAGDDELPMNAQPHSPTRIIIQHHNM